MKIRWWKPWGSYCYTDASDDFHGLCGGARDFCSGI